MFFYCCIDGFLNLIQVICISILNYTGIYLYHRKKIKYIIYVLISLDIILLFSFKYVNNIFASSNFFQLEMPLGISFIIFHLLAFVIDAYKGNITKICFSNFLAYLTFFPHMIAGPIVYYKEITQQFSKKIHEDEFWSNFSIGLILFAFGVFKKVIIADSLSPWVDEFYNNNLQSSNFGFIDVIIVMLSYSLQIYFDFSGYSDMAIGLAKLFQIDFPVNFLSPYKSVNFIEFWRRWHISLSNFFKVYLYIPLGGSKNGFWHQQFNVLFVMILCGAWHGSTLNFVVWGFLHGLCLVINRIWFNLQKMFFPNISQYFIARTFSTLITFSLVTILWAFFRSSSLMFSVCMFKKLLSPDIHDILLYSQFKTTLISMEVDIYRYFIILALLVFFVFLAPNSNQIIEFLKKKKIFDSEEPSYIFSKVKLALVRESIVILIVSFMILSALLASRSPSFIYFKF